jgi:hypothetical protein
VSGSGLRGAWKNQNTVGGNIEDAAAAFEKFGL